MKLTKDQVKKVAKLASLPIEDKYLEVYASQLTKILDHIDQLDKLKTDNVEPIYNVSQKRNITETDRSSNSLTQEEALKNAKNQKNGYFLTKGVFENE